ncbi:MAG: (2Fe-2S)-binding protein [Lautropia sp.]
MARLRVNGIERTFDAAPCATLVDVLRDALGLTGTHVGCDTAQCGACTVLLGTRAVKACNVLAARCGAEDVLTVEGLAPGPDRWHPMQLAFSRHGALQCGFCTPGMLMRAVAMAYEGVPPEPAAVREALAGNLCRCTGYHPIVAAICEGLTQMASVPHAAGDGS